MDKTLIFISIVIITIIIFIFTSAQSTTSLSTTNTPSTTNIPFTQSKEFYPTNLFPSDFQKIHNTIIQECQSILPDYRTMNTPLHNPAPRKTRINHIFREKEVWSHSSKLNNFLAKHNSLTGWVPAWSPKTPTKPNYSWLNFPFIAKDTLFENNMKLCPKTATLLKKYKSKINIAGFSLMRPNSEIPIHQDTTGLKYGSMAYHLGLIIPPNSSCTLTVNGITVPQHKGKSLIFDSTFLHSAANTSNQDRVILYIDFKL